MTEVTTEMPRSRSMAIQSERVERRSFLALTCPASWIAPPNSRSFSVNVVLPASGWEMMAKVRRRSTSVACGGRAGAPSGVRMVMGSVWQIQPMRSRTISVKAQQFPCTTCHKVRHVLCPFPLGPDRGFFSRTYFQCATGRPRDPGGDLPYLCVHRLWPEHPTGQYLSGYPWLCPGSLQPKGALGGAVVDWLGRGGLDVRDLRIRPFRIQSSVLQRDHARRFWHAGGTPVRCSEVLCFLPGDGSGRRRSPSCRAFRRPCACDWRVGFGFRRHGGGHAFYFPGGWTDIRLGRWSSKWLLGAGGAIEDDVAGSPLVRISGRLVRRQSIVRNRHHFDSGDRTTDDSLGSAYRRLFGGPSRLCV